MVSTECLPQRSFPKRASGLEINAIEGGFMVYQSERNRVHYLNHTAVLILELCNGANSVAQIAKLVRDAFGLEDTHEVEVGEIMTRMEEEALVELG